MARNFKAIGGTLVGEASQLETGVLVSESSEESLTGGQQQKMMGKMQLCPVNEMSVANYQQEEVMHESMKAVGEAAQRH